MTDKGRKDAAGYDVYFVIQGEDGRDTTAVMEGFLTEEAAQAWIDMCGEQLAEAHIVPR